MKIFIAAIGTAGDVYPFVGIGRHLVQRGHEVRLASNERHRSVVEAAGVKFVEVPGVQSPADSADFYHPTRGMRLVAEAMLIPAIKPVYELVSGLARGEWAVLADSFCYGARVARERSGEPLTTGLVSPFGLRSLVAKPVTPGPPLPAWIYYRIAGTLWDRLLGPPLNAFRSGLKMPPVRDIWYGWSLSPERIIGLFPEWFAPRAADWPPQLVHGGFTVLDQGGASPLPYELLSEGGPIVVFCAGSAGLPAASFFETAVEASRGRAWRAVLLGGGSAGLPQPLPANVLPYRFLPLSRLLPLSSVVVHHGGLGTLSLALASGTPQIVIPFGHDQFDNAARLKRLGVARVIEGKSNRDKRLADAVEASLRNEALLVKGREVSARTRPEAALENIARQLESDWDSHQNGTG